MTEIIRIKSILEITELAELAAECFVEDPFYRLLGGNEIKLKRKIKKLFIRSLEVSLKYGFVTAHRHEGKFISMCSWVDYHYLATHAPNDFDFIFPDKDASNNKASAFASKEFKYISDMTSSAPMALYLVSICVLPNHRCKGLATELVASTLQAFPQYSFFSDISNSESLGIYERLGFEVSDRLEDIVFIKKYSQDTSILFENDIIKLAIPYPVNIELLPLFKDIEIEHLIDYSGLKHDEEIIAFIPDISATNSQCKMAVIDIDYDRLLQYQSMVGMNAYSEVMITACGNNLLCYVRDLDFINETDGAARNSRKSRHGIDYEDCSIVSKIERKVVPDITISIPISYSDSKAIIGNRMTIHNSSYARKMKGALNFRTDYESGCPEMNNADYGFKSRIERICLGTIELQLESEPMLSFCSNSEHENLGLPFEVSMLLSIDNRSKCGVLHIFVPSSGLYASQLLDSMSRNQLTVRQKDSTSSLFNYIDKKFGLKKCGAPKAFVTIFEDKDNFNTDFLGSLLFGETFYEDNTGLGKVIDHNISSQLKSRYGVAQYNYASVYCYKNVLIQMTSRFRTSVDSRIIQESITLFYIELILFEEAAIVDVERNISIFLNNLDEYTNSKVMSNINTILSNYAKSSDFWDIQMNYPSSRKSVEEIRSAFEIGKLREDVSKKKDMLLNICTIRDTILDETEGYFISIIGIIVAAFSCVDLIHSAHIRQIIGFVLILVSILIALRYRMNHKIRLGKIQER